MEGECVRVRLCLIIVYLPLRLLPICIRRTSKKAVPLGTGNSPNTPSGRLAAEAYDTLKDKQLRERLQRFELPTTGSRAKLQARHARWVVLYNANLDHAPERQKSISALRAELIAWESGKEKDEREHAKAQERSGFTGGDTTLAADYGVSTASDVPIWIVLPDQGLVSLENTPGAVPNADRAGTEDEDAAAQAAGASRGTRDGG